MGKTMISVRDVDEDVFRKFRSMSVEERMKIGPALTRAMRKFLEEKEKSSNLIKAPKVKPFNWGEGTENTSKKIDKIIYK